ncbi:four and a half LIM domains protein 2-like [Convolutriloba macropyga]|uniref:four and a half LIM domains protein 2-like n=1 Tax=Convolutriloba macropyga TaxID=536237 RepID=UPI003F51E9A1
MSSCLACNRNIDVRTESKIATRPSGEPEQAYHVKCFHCANCRSFLAGVPFYETSDGVLMCKQCTSQTEPRRCSKCKTTVYGAMTKSSDGKSLYHSGCAPIHVDTRCQGWRRPNWDVRTDNQFCYNCKHPIGGGKVHYVFGHSIHAECFKCPFCQKYLGPRLIEMKGQKVCCLRCGEPDLPQLAQTGGKSL